MKGYVATTVVLFGALTILHAWRAVAARSSDPAFLIITIVAGAFTIWGAFVWVRVNRGAA